MHSTKSSRWISVLVFMLACLLPTPATCHPGSGIVPRITKIAPDGKTAIIATVTRH